MVGDAVLSAKASGDVGGQVRMLEMLGDGFNEAKRYGEALAFFERAMKLSATMRDAGFPFMAYEGGIEIRYRHSLSGQLSILLLKCLIADPQSPTIFVQTDARCRMRLMLKSSEGLNRISHR